MQISVININQVVVSSIWLPFSKLAAVGYTEILLLIWRMLLDGMHFSIYNADLTKWNCAQNGNVNLRSIPKSLFWGWPLHHPYARMLPTQGQVIDVCWRGFSYPCRSPHPCCREGIAWNRRLHPVSGRCSMWHIADCTNCSKRSISF